MAAAAKGLGRGLSSLMGEGVTMSENLGTGGDNPKATATLPVTALKAGKYQPRRHFDEESLSELADSIEKHGLMQPIVVRMVGNGHYEIIAGERRWRAAKLAKVADVPVIIREVNDSEALELALIENIQRADLNPLEEAAGYQRLMNEFGYTQEKLAPVVGKSRSHVANLLRLLKLPESVKKRIDTGELTMGHARAILMSSNPEELARQIIEIGLTVRQAEEMAKGMQPASPNVASTGERKSPTTPRRAGSGHKSEDVLQLENMLADSLGLRVSIDTRGGQAGDVVISYDSLSQLDEILRRLGGGV